MSADSLGAVSGDVSVSMGGGASAPPPADGNAPRTRLSDFTPGAKPATQASPQAKPATQQTSTGGQPSGEPSMFLDDQSQGDTQTDPAQRSHGTTDEEPSMFLDGGDGDGEGQSTSESGDIGERAQQWMEDTNLDMETFGEKLVELKGKNGVEYLSVNELRQNGMRLKDYSRAMNEYKAKDEQLNAAAKQWKEHLQEVATNPELFLQVYEEQFGTEHIMKVAGLLAQREQQDARIIRGAAIAAATEVMEQYGIQDINDPRIQPIVQQAAQEARQRIANERKLMLDQSKVTRQSERMKKEREAAQREQQLAEQSKKIEAQIQTLGQAALKTVKLNWAHPTVRNGYLEALKSVMQQTGEKVINKQVCIDAAHLLRDHLRSTSTPGTASNTGTPISPTRQAGAGGGARNSRGGQQQRQTITEFARSKR